MAIVHRRSDGGPYSIMSNGCTVWQAAMKSPKDRKSTRLNSSHSQISYAVFCLKKKKKKGIQQTYLNTTETLRPNTDPFQRTRVPNLLSAFALLLHSICHVTSYTIESSQTIQA